MAGRYSNGVVVEGEDSISKVESCLSYRWKYAPHSTSLRRRLNESHGLHRSVTLSSFLNEISEVAMHSISELVRLRRVVKSDPSVRPYWNYSREARITPSRKTEREVQ